ncbi:MAG: DUF3368 domain-containing protein [Polyangia bacterium]
MLAWALAHPGARAIIDDLHGRRCGEALGIPLRGTVGLVLRARRSRKIASARDAFERLRAGGMYLSDRPRRLEGGRRAVGQRVLLTHGPRRVRPAGCVGPGHARATERTA